MSQTLQLNIRNRQEKIFDGPVLSVTSFNDKGRFDILPEHANFISLIDKYLIFREKGGEEKEMEVKNGLMRVAQGRVDVFLGIKKE